MKNLNTITAPVWPIALCRIVIGGLWLSALIWKLPPNFIPLEGLRSLKEWMELEVQYPVVPFYAQFVQAIVLPNFMLFAWATFIVELLIGLGLLLGIFTRAAAVLGLLMALNLTIGLLNVPNEWAWSYFMLLLFQILFTFTDPGRVWGIDGWRARRQLRQA
jgi:thiosulfate dehydrogenase (quinone) large subunit